MGISTVNIFSFISKVNVGKITDKKIDTIKNNVFNNQVNLMISDIEAVFLSNDQKLQVILTSDQINITLINAVESDSKILAEYTEKIFSSLLLDETIDHALMRCISTPLHTENSMTFTKNLITAPILGDETGIGLRYLFKNKLGQYDEFKFEPSVNNQNEFYIEGLYNLKNFLINDVESFSKDKILDFFARIRKFNI